MRAVTRTINSTSIEVSYFAGGILVEKDPVVVPGKVIDASRQMKAVRSVYGKNANVVITGYKVIDEKRAISFEDFMKYSVIVADEENEEQE